MYKAFLKVPKLDIYTSSMSLDVLWIPMYVDSYDNQLSLLPTVKYSDICNFIKNHTIDGNDPQKAFKSLDSYHMVCSDGWMGSLNVKKCRNTVLVKCDVKPSQ